MNEYFVCGGLSLFCIIVHGHGEPDLKVLVEHLAAERDSLTEHVYGHEAEGLAIHQEPVSLHRGKAVAANH